MINTNNKIKNIYKKEYKNKLIKKVFISVSKDFQKVILNDKDNKKI